MRDIVLLYIVSNDVQVQTPRIKAPQPFFIRQLSGSAKH